MSRVFALLILGLTPFAPALLGQNTPPVVRLEIKGAFTPARAMKLLYSNYDDTEQVAVWSAKRTKSYAKNWPEKVDVHVLLDASYVEAGRPKHLLVTWAIPKETYAGEFSCHSCGVLLGVSLFVKDGDIWRVEASDLEFGEYSSWGHPPTINLQPIGPDRFGLIMPMGFGGQGVWEESVTIIVPVSGKFVEGLSMQIAQTWDEDRCSGEVTSKSREDCFAYDGGIDWDPTPSSQFYDLLLTKRVYRTLSKKTREGTTITRYHFDGSKYVVKSASK